MLEELVFIKDGVAILKSDWREFGEKYFREKCEELSNRQRRKEEEGKSVFGWRNGELMPEGKARYVWLITPEIVKEEVKPRLALTLEGVASLGYGAKNFKEFFSVAAEFYIRGRDRFVGTYEPFLGRERAEKLYDGMRREIFRGREY